MSVEIEFILALQRISAPVDEVGFKRDDDCAKVGFDTGDFGANLRFEKIRERDGDQNQNDGDDNQEFDKGEASSAFPTSKSGHR